MTHTKQDHLDRIPVITDYQDHQISAERAAQLLGCSRRTFLRWVKAYRERGKKAFVHGNTGAIPHNRFSPEMRRTLHELLEQK